MGKGKRANGRRKELRNGRRGKDEEKGKKGRKK
jgi:hypothetical protein